MKKALLLLVTLAAGLLLLFYWWRREPATPAVPLPPPVESAAPEPFYDLERRPVSLIEPGTVIDGSPPSGWTHLIVKTYPRPASGDMDRIPSIAKPLTTLLCTTMLASVETIPYQGHEYHRLARAAEGLGAKIHGHDTIIDPWTQQALGANLGPVACIVLAGADAKLRQSVQVMHSDSLAVIDAPAVMMREGKHQPVVHRHVLLLDPHSGELATLVWAIDLDANGELKEVSGPASWLPNNWLQECRLHVDGGQFTFGLPGDMAFALETMPEGQAQIPLPVDLRGLAVQKEFTRAEAETLSGRLWEAIRANGHGD